MTRLFALTLIVPSELFSPSNPELTASAETDISILFSADIATNADETLTVTPPVIVIS